MPNPTLSKSDLRAARKTARANGQPLTGVLALAGDIKTAANRPIRKPRRRRTREDAMTRWAIAYDALNGAPESEYDR